MSSGGFQNFFHLITGLPGGFGTGGTIPAALLATLAGAGALTAGVTAAAALAAVLAGGGDVDADLSIPAPELGLPWPQNVVGGLAFKTSGKIALARGRRATVAKASGPRRPIRP